MRLSTIVKLIWVVFLLALLFHPVLTIAFIVSNLGTIGGLLAVYFLFRLIVGMSLIEYIRKEFEKEKNDK